MPSVSHHVCPLIIQIKWTREVLGRSVRCPLFAVLLRASLSMSLSAFRVVLLLEQFAADRLWPRM